MPTDTKQMIAQRLFELLEYKKFEDITVKYLVEACHISRQTFYYHFQDIMDVLEWGARQAVERALEGTMEAQDLQEAVRVFARHIARRKEINRRLLQSQRRAELEGILVDALKTYLRELFRRKWPNPRLAVADIGVYLDFYAYGLAGLLLNNCGPGSVDEELLADQIYRILTGEMQRQLAGDE